MNILKCFLRRSNKKKRVSYDQQMVLIEEHRRITRRAQKAVERTQERLEKARLDGEDTWPCYIKECKPADDTDDKEGHKNGRISNSVFIHDAT